VVEAGLVVVEEELQEILLVMEQGQEVNWPAALVFLGERKY
jgi:hypothetical protein